MRKQREFSEAKMLAHSKYVVGPAQRSVRSVGIGFAATNPRTIQGDKTQLQCLRQLVIKGGDVSGQSHSYATEDCGTVWIPNLGERDDAPGLGIGCHLR